LSRLAFFLGLREGKTCLPAQAQHCHVSRRDGVPFSVNEGRLRQESVGSRSEALRGERRRPPPGQGGNQRAPHCTSLSRGTPRRHGGIKRRGGLLCSQLRAMDMENLMEVTSRQGNVTAATHAKNKDKLRADSSYRGAGLSSSSAKILAAADEACGLQEFPDNERLGDVMLFWALTRRSRQSRRYFLCTGQPVRPQGPCRWQPRPCGFARLQQPQAVGWWPMALCTPSKP